MSKFWDQARVAAESRLPKRFGPVGSRAVWDTPDIRTCGRCGYHACSCPVPTAAFEGTSGKIVGFDPALPGSEFTILRTVAGDIRIVSDPSVGRGTARFISEAGEFTVTASTGSPVSSDNVAAHCIAEEIRKAMKGAAR